MALKEFWTTDKIIKATSAKTASKGIKDVFSDISIDSREVKKDYLFVPIKGENFDGHDFIDKAVNNGAAGIIAHKSHEELIEKYKDINIFLVDDTTKALGDLAKFKRDSLDIKIIGVTGSAGKTSTREILKTILGTKTNVLSPIKNFNNHIGVPLTLLRADETHGFGVIEMGMSNPGEIEYLSNIASPEMAIITKIAPAHIGSFESIEGIAKEKASINKGMKDKSAVIINEEDQLLEKYLENSSVLKFGFTETSHLKIIQDPDGGTKNSASFIYSQKNNDLSFSAEIGVKGKTALKNAGAAVIAAILCGYDIESIKSGLLKYNGVKGRFFELYDSKKEIHIIDDTYNANPESLKASINDFSKIKKNSQSFIVLGDMLELGEKAREYHVEAGNIAALSKPDGIFAYGEFSDAVLEGVNEKTDKDIFVFKGDHKQISQELSKRLLPGDWVMIKGSRGAKMENVLNFLIEKPE